MSTYLDSGVLIAASKGDWQVANIIDQLLDDDREITSSIFVKLETIPKAVWHKNSDELDYYQKYFDYVVDRMTNDMQAISDVAFSQACKYGIAAMDACHIAAAYMTNSKEIVTTEKKTKPMYRTELVKVVYLWDAIVE